MFGLNVGPIGIRWYALAYITGIVLGWLYAARLLKNQKLWGERGPPIQTRQLDDLVLWLTMGIILGGRFGYVLFYGSSQSSFWEHPLNILKIWDGGMSFHGGLIGVALALILYAWRGLNGSWSGAAFVNTFRLSSPQNVWRLGDVIAPVAPVGLFFGRIANFINGELWGRPTKLPWGVTFCNDNILHTQGGCPVGPRHPSQLYEAGLEGLVLFCVLAWGAYKLGWLKRPGIATGVFLLGYGLSRLALENVREPDQFMPVALTGWITMGMILCIPMILGGVWLIWAARKQPAE
ncbi:MAG TPA: prolipoprotein diacylglyceryl transferase [Caulobacteraceae bacterium]